MSINIINSIDKKIGNYKHSTITVATIGAAKAASEAKADIIINNPLDILLNSISIKDILNNKKDVLFNLQKLNKAFVKGFIYRIIQGLYVFSKYKSINNDIINILFYSPQLSKADIDSLFNVLNYSNISRNIINEPSNIFTPEKLAAYACGLFKKSKNVKINNYRHADIKRMGLRLIDAVGGSSRNKPHFLVLDYKPAKSHKTICLVGKGVTLDTGG